MKKVIVSLLAFLFLLISYGEVFATVWVNNTPGALVKRIETYENNNIIQIDNPLFPVLGYVNITFQNDVVIPGLARHPTAGSISPSFLPLVENNYTSYAVYLCQAGSSPAIGETCDGIAMRSQNGQLCAGYFRYTTLVDRVATIADIGCFTMVELNRAPHVAKKDFLQRYSKEQLIDIISGVRLINPIGPGPVCLSCPPWDGYEKDIDVKLQGLKVKKFKLEVREIR